MVNGMYYYAPDLYIIAIAKINDGKIRVACFETRNSSIVGQFFKSEAIVE